MTALSSPRPATRDGPARTRHHHPLSPPSLYGAAQRALIFNVLDAAVFPEHPLLVGRDVAAVQAFCCTLAPRVELVRGYLDDDATLVLRRR